MGRGENGEFWCDPFGLKCISSRKLVWCSFPLCNVWHIYIHLFNNNIADSSVFNRYLLVEVLLDQSGNI